MVVLLAVGAAVALVVGGAPELHVTGGTGEVLRVPLSPESIHNLGENRLLARRTDALRGRVDPPAGHVLVQGSQHGVQVCDSGLLPDLLGWS